MTGFSSCSAEIITKDGRKICLSIEMKSINSRFFELSSKLPSILNHLEIKISNLLQKKLLRGRVYLVVQPADDIEPLTKIVPCTKIVQGYLDAIASIKNQCTIPGDLNISDILKLPDVFVVQKNFLAAEDEMQLLSILETVADKLNKTRAQEGAQLEPDFTLRFDTCLEKITLIKKAFEALMADLKQQVDKNLELIQAGREDVKLQLDDLYATINKIDVQEEITRFTGHLSSAKEFLKKETTEKGKRLDFILQELLRETNTIMAKCTNFEISSAGVDIKVELEKIREQDQNIL
jgi:uncharacterized protein (TIGR00255 family)